MPHPFLWPDLNSTLTGSSPPDAGDESRLLAHLAGLARLFQASGHDLRGPVHAITLHLELLRSSVDEVDDRDLRARQTRSVEAIARETQRLTRLLEALWGEDQPMDPSAGRFDLRDTVHAIRPLIDPYCRRSRVQLHTRLPESEVAVEGNPAALRHAALDLLIHAMDQMPEGGDLEISVEARGRSAVLAVATPSLSARGPDGPYVALRVAERHGGRLRPLGGTGEASGFELEVPLPPEPPSDIHSAPREREHHAGSPHR